MEISRGAFQGTRANTIPRWSAYQDLEMKVHLCATPEIGFCCRDLALCSSPTSWGWKVRCRLWLDSTPVQLRCGKEGRPISHLSWVCQLQYLNTPRPSWERISTTKLITMRDESDNTSKTSHSYGNVADMITRGNSHDMAVADEKRAVLE